MTIRQLAIRVCAVLLPFLVLEGAARVVDSLTHFIDETRRTLYTYAVSANPAPKEKYPAPQGSIWIRSDEQKSFPAGQLFQELWEAIPGTGRFPVRTLINPEALAHDSHRRIFIVGESNAFGNTCSYRQSFGGRLDQALDERGYRVLNAAMPASTSSSNLELVHKLVDSFKPEDLVLLMGNNEWIHWSPPIQARMSLPLLLTLNRLTESYAAGAMIYGWLKIIANHQDDLRRWFASGFHIHYEREGVRYALQHPLDELESWEELGWPAKKREFLLNFENNLKAMVEYAKHAGVRVVLLNVPFNYKLSPAWKHPQPESAVAAVRDQVRQSIRQAASALDRRDYAQALTIVDAALKLDDFPPVLHYLRAMCLEATGRPLEAETSYARSRENMIGNLGGILSINAVIEKTAAVERVELLDVRKLFDDYEHAHGRYFNVDFISDDCHPTALGHQLIAEALERMLGHSR